METAIVYSEDSRQRIQNRVTNALKTKLIGNKIDNANELSIKLTEMMASGHSKDEVLAELKKYSKTNETKDLDQINKHNKIFIDYLFSYSSILHPLHSQQDNDETPLTEADTEAAVEINANDHQTNATPIEDVTEEDEDEEKETEELKKEKEFTKNDETIETEEEKAKVTEEEIVNNESKDQEQKTDETEKKIEEEKKSEVPKRRSFIRIKEGKSGRFTPIKSEDRHSFVKRNLGRAASKLDVADQVEKKMKSHAVSVANNAESLVLNKKKSAASLNNNTLEKKKSYRRDSNASNTSSTSVYSSTNATFNKSFAGKTYSKTNKAATININEQSDLVRCTYWPNCSRGDECKFWHPKELCPDLNNCPYGDKCLYIHPAIPQNQLNKKNKKKSENNLEINEITKHTVQKKLSKRESLASIASNSSQSKKNIKNNIKENNNANGAVNNLYAIECKFGANCTRPDCKYSHPSPAAILATKKNEVANILKKKESGKLKEKKSHNILKHKESKNSNKSFVTQNGDLKKTISTEEVKTILCRFDPNCKRENCKFMHTNK